MQGRSSPEKVEFILVSNCYCLILHLQVVRFGISLKLSLYLTLTESYFRPIQVGPASVPGYFSIILIGFKIIQRNSFFSKISGWNL